MKKKILIGVGGRSIGLHSLRRVPECISCKPSKNASISDKGLDIKVTYGGPFKKGRLIFGEEKDKALQPYGKYWRLGANAATEITFSKNVTFGGKPVNAR